MHGYAGDFYRQQPLCDAWFETDLPNICKLVEHRPERTIFTKFMPLATPEDAVGRDRSGNNDRCAVLIVMKYRNIHLLTKLFFNFETFRCVHIFEVYAESAFHSLLHLWSAGLIESALFQN